MLQGRAVSGLACTNSIWIETRFHANFDRAGESQKMGRTRRVAIPRQRFAIYREIKNWIGETAVGSLIQAAHWRGRVLGLLEGVV